MHKCTPVRSLRLWEARPGGGFREVVLSPEAAALCQAGRVASDGVPRLSAQVVEQQHRLVCFCAKSSPAPHPDHCLLSLCSHAQTRRHHSIFLSLLH